MVSNIPPNLILAGLVALIALPFVVVACSIYVADRLVRALHSIYRLQKEEAAAARRSAAALAAAVAALPAPPPAAATLAPPSARTQSERVAVDSHIPAPAASTPAPGVGVAASMEPAQSPLEGQKEQVSAIHQVPEPTAAEVSPAQMTATAPTVGAATADTSPDAPAEPPPTEHSEAELEAQRARVRQMMLGG